jgi:putative membrane-bound dehydrogenase-like protein
LDGLNLPTGVLPWRGGVLITAAPEILWAKDTDGDGRADKREVLYDGFRPGNPQHRVNGLRWGLDNWIHIANGDSDGIIRSVKTGKTVNISGRDLRIRPDEGLLEAQSGETQFGRCRDDWGNWFGNNNSDALWHYVLRDHYLRRNPHAVSPSARRRVPVEEGRLRLFPTSVTVERFNDFHTANLVTSSCGTGIYRDEWLGDEFYGNAFICEPVHNLVIRQVLTPSGLTFSSRRAPGGEEREFLSSSDNWFRPVTAKTGPDGALYIVDMYRHVIEHPEWIPQSWQKRLDLRQGEDKGRIYRLVRRGKERKKISRLDNKSTLELSRVLGTANGELRDMLHVEILHRADRGAVALRRLATVSESAAVRLQALSILDGMEVEMGSDLLQGMLDRSPEVRRHAIRIAEKMAVTPQLLEALGKLLDDPDPRVRHQLHLSLGNFKAPEVEAVIELACRRFREEGAQEALMRAGLISSVNPAVAARILAAGHEKMSRALVKDLLATAQGKDGKNQVVEVLRTAVGKPRGNGPPPKGIAEQLKLHSGAEKLLGRLGQGRTLFEAQCAACHRVQGKGNEVGPDLTALTDLSFSSLLTAIVDPNAALEDKFVMHTIKPSKGEELVGAIQSETSTAIFLKLADGSERILLKKEVREVQSMGRSLMPEGFGASHRPQDLADLIKYLQSVRPPPKKFAGNEPALIESAEDGSFILLAAKAAVYGPRLAYGRQYKMLEYWKSERDYAVWDVDCRKAGKYRVTADIACETRVENRFQVIAGASRISAIVLQTKNWADFQRKEYGVLELRQGRQEIVVRSDGPVKNFLMDLQGVTLTPQ